MSPIILNRHTTEESIGFWYKTFWMTLLGVMFFVFYGMSGYFVSHYIKDAPSIFLDFESYMPFWEWLITPYMSSDIIFIVVFYCCTTRLEMLNLVKRTTVAVLVATLFFVLLPLKFSFAKPEVINPYNSFWFELLTSNDTIYNQAPSLHVCYAVIFYSVLKDHTKGIMKAITGIWCFLIGISTIFVYQHHVIDLFSAGILMSLVFLLFPQGLKRSQRVGIFFLLISNILATLAILLIVFTDNSLWYVLFSGSLSLLSVGLCYIYNKPSLLKLWNVNIWRKQLRRSKNLNCNAFVSLGLYLLNILKLIINWPYYLGQFINWFFFAKKDEHLKVEVSNLSKGSIRKLKAHNASIEICKLDDESETLKNTTNISKNITILVGARLHKKGYQALTKGSQLYVLDLSAELQENYWCSRNCNCNSYPILDLVEHTSEELVDISNELDLIVDSLKDGDVLYIHCMLGKSRSFLVALLCLIKFKNMTFEEAKCNILSNSKNAFLPNYLFSDVLEIKQI